MRNEFSDKDLRAAAALVRQSMLAELDRKEIPDYRISPVLVQRILALKAWEKRRQLRKRSLHRFAAAMIALLLGASLFLTINPEARAAAASWFKEIFSNKTEFWFTQNRSTAVSLEMEIGWKPEGLDLVSKEITKDGCILLYMNPNEPKEGFTLSSSYMQKGSFSIVGYRDGSHSITPVQVNELYGELYSPADQQETKVLIWFDEAKGVCFGITTNYDSEVILHIAESVKLTDLTK